MKNFRIESAILAVGLLLLGLCIRSGINSFTNSNRSVSVKGLAETEVPADKVTWSITYQSLGNDLIALYDQIKQSNQTVIAFLKEKGITSQEISLSAPDIYDSKGDRWNNNANIQFRYNVNSTITITSRQTDKVKALITEQGELLKKGITISSNSATYEYTGLNNIKPKMIEEATKNARAAAMKFAKDSDSKLGKIRHANQGQFSIEDRDQNTPYIKKIRVVTTIDYSLED